MTPIILKILNRVFKASGLIEKALKLIQDTHHSAWSDARTWSHPTWQECEAAGDEPWEYVRLPREIAESCPSPEERDAALAVEWKKRRAEWFETKGKSTLAFLHHLAAIQLACWKIQSAIKEMTLTMQKESDLNAYKMFDSKARERFEAESGGAGKS